MRHLPGLRTYVHLKAGALVLAREGESDIVQSACREVLQHAASFQYGGEAGFRHWLYATALRKLLDKRAFHGAERRDPRREQSLPNEHEPRAELAELRCASPSGVAIAREELDRLARELGALEDDQREVVLLSKVVGLSRAEVAREMRRSEASVRNLLHRALARLADALERGAEQDSLGQARDARD